MAEMPEKKDVINTRDPKEVPLPPDIAALRAGFPNLVEARKLFSGTGPTAGQYLNEKKLTPKTVVDQRHVETLRELKAKFEGKDNRTLEALSVINQTNAQLVRLQQVNDKTRAIPTDEERAVLSSEVIFTILPHLMDRNLRMIDRYLVLKQQHAAYGVTPDPAIEKAVQDQLGKFNTAAAARLALWGSRDLAALQKATDDLQLAINPLPAMVNALYGDIIDRALRKNNELILKKGGEYEAELRLKMKAGKVSDQEKKEIFAKYRAQVDELQKIGSSLGVELESLLRHNGLENIADMEALSVPEAERDFQRPAPVGPAEVVPEVTAREAAVEGEKIANSSIDAMTENFREHFDMVLGPRDGRPAKGYENDYLLNTKRWDIRAEHAWTKHAIMRVAQVLNLMAKYRGGVRSLVVNGPRKVAVGITRATVGDTTADAIDYSMKKVMSTKEGAQYAQDHMVEILKSLGLPPDFDLNSAKDWQDLEEDKRWPGAKEKHEKKMMTVKDNIEKFRAEVEGPAKDFEADLNVLDALRKKTDPLVILDQRADQAMVIEFRKKNLTPEDIAKIDPKDGSALLAAYVALYLQMRGHWDAYCRAMGKLEVGILENIQRHQDTSVAANAAGGNMNAEDDDLLRWLVFGATGIATAYVLGGRGGLARPFGNRISMRRPLARIGNSVPSLFDRTFYSGPRRALRQGSVGSYLRGWFAPGDGTGPAAPVEAPLVADLPGELKSALKDAAKRFGRLTVGEGAAKWTCDLKPDGSASFRGNGWTLEVDATGKVTAVTGTPPSPASLQSSLRTAADTKNVLDLESRHGIVTEARGAPPVDPSVTPPLVVSEAWAGRMKIFTGLDPTKPIDLKLVQQELREAVKEKTLSSGEAAEIQAKLNEIETAARTGKLTPVDAAAMRSKIRDAASERGRLLREVREIKIR